MNVVNPLTSSTHLAILAVGVCISLAPGCALADATVTGTGFILCQDNSLIFNPLPLEGARVEMMDSDCDGSEVCDDVMATGVVQADGSFTVTGSGGDVFGGDPDVYIRIAYNDDQGVRLTDEVDSTRSWSSPQHEHNNTPNGATIDFGAKALGAGGGTRCGVWKQGHINFQNFVHEIGSEPPSGHLDIEYWSGILDVGDIVPWTNTDTIHWPIAFPSFALTHEFGHSIRHGADGNDAHFVYDAARFQYARSHDECADDGNRNSGETDESLRGFAFNEGWAEYWNGDGKLGACGAASRDIEGNVAFVLEQTQTANALSRKDMLAVLEANPGSIHGLDEFLSALQRLHPGAIVVPLTVGSNQPAKTALASSFSEIQLRALVERLASDIKKQMASLQHRRAEALAPRPCVKCKLDFAHALVKSGCPDCTAKFRQIVDPALMAGEIKVLEIRLRALRQALSPKWIAAVQRARTAGRFDAVVALYKSDLRKQMREAMFTALSQAQSGVRAARPQFPGQSYALALSRLELWRRRLDGSDSLSGAQKGMAIGWLPQMTLLSEAGQSLTDFKPK